MIRIYIAYVMENYNWQKSAQMPSKITIIPTRVTNVVAMTASIYFVFHWTKINITKRQSKLESDFVLQF